MFIDSLTKQKIEKYQALTIRISNGMDYFDKNPDQVYGNKAHSNFEKKWLQLANEQNMLLITIENRLGRTLTHAEILGDFSKTYELRGGKCKK